MIELEKVSFSYTKEPFIEDITFQVGYGEVFGFLGPSGAGKSTLQKILIGMLTNYKGSVKVHGVEVKKHNNSFYQQIGIDFEFPSLYEKLTARQNLSFFASLYEKQTQNIEVLLESVGLTQDGDKKVSEYSKGMKSRLNFIKALVHNPNIIFLDEPTSGLDPTNSRVMKDIILKLKSEGKTIILTTHNMEDATELCDRVAFIVDGKIKAMDSPHNLIMKKSATSIEYTYLQLEKECKGGCEIQHTGSDQLLMQLIKENRLITIHSKEQSLGDVFMEVTGRRLS